MSGDLWDPLPGRMGGEPRLDRSGFLVHFTEHKSELVEILKSGFLEARQCVGYLPSTVKPVGDSKRSACLGELSFITVRDLAAQHGLWGFSFRKEFIVEQGGNPTLTLRPGTPAAAFIEGLRRDKSFTQDPDHPMWALVPFIDIETENFKFEWERAWRVPGGLSFRLEDVDCLVLGWPDDPTFDPWATAASISDELGHELKVAGFSTGGPPDIPDDY